MSHQCPVYVRPDTNVYCRYPLQEVIPQFFERDSCFGGGPYHEKATHAYKVTEGMVPPDLRAGLAFDKLLQEMFSDNEVETRSQGLVEGVRSYMKTARRRLFERECRPAQGDRHDPCWGVHQNKGGQDLGSGV